MPRAVEKFARAKWHGWLRSHPLPKLSPAVLLSMVASVCELLRGVGYGMPESTAELYRITSEAVLATPAGPTTPHAASSN